MQDLYATNLNLVHVGGGDAFSVAVDRASSWSTRRFGVDPPDLEEEPIGGIEPAAPEEGTLSWWSALEGEARAVEFRLRHPDGTDASLTWEAVATVSQIDEVVRATVRLSRGANVHLLRPAHLALRPPTLVRELMRAPLLAYVGAVELSEAPVALDATDIAAFVPGVLRAGGRALPLILVDSGANHFFAQGVARATAGLAHVYRLKDESARAALSEAAATEPEQVVPSAGVRLFWPGTVCNGSGLVEPRWSAERIAAVREGGPSALDEMVNLLAPISTGRVPTDPGVLRARRAWLVKGAGEAREREEARRARARQEREQLRAERLSAGSLNELERLREEGDHLREALSDAEEDAMLARAEANRAAANELKVIEESLDLAEKEHSQATRIEQLEIEVATLKANLRTLRAYDAASQVTEVPAVERAKITSWPDLAEALAALEQPGFVLTDRARACADGSSRYPHVARMWTALCDLAKVGAAYHAANARTGMRFEEFAITTGGLTIALQDSTYADSCDFEFEGAWHKRLPHVKIDDAKAPNEVGRIYFALDADNARIIVDWFGSKPDRHITGRR